MVKAGFLELAKLDTIPLNICSGENAKPNGSKTLYTIGGIINYNLYYLLSSKKIYYEKL